MSHSPHKIHGCDAHSEIQIHKHILSLILAYRMAHTQKKKHCRTEELIRNICTPVAPGELDIRIRVHDTARGWDAARYKMCACDAGCIREDRGFTKVSLIPNALKNL